MINFYMENMNNSLLEKLSLSNEKGFFKNTPWIHWESENSSFGKCFRKWALYPSFLPLFMCSTHTAYNGSYSWPNELDKNIDLFWGWPKQKIARRIKNYQKKNSFTVAHPWIYYRKNYIGNVPKKRSGVLYFFPHYNDNWEPRFESLDKLINNLKIIGYKNNGITICLSFHDIRRGLHKELRKYSIPLVTAGNTNSHLFVNRFYNLIYNYMFTSSSSIGAHTYYSIEAGIPHFLLNKKNLRFVGSGIYKSKNKVRDNKYFYNKKELIEIVNFEKSLNIKKKNISNFQKKFVLNKLGYYDSINRLKASSLLWKALLFNLHNLFYIYFKIILSKSLNLLKKLII